MTKDTVQKWCESVCILFSDLCSNNVELEFATFVEAEWDAYLT